MTIVTPKIHLLWISSPQLQDKRAHVLNSSLTRNLWRGSLSICDSNLYLYSYQKYLPDRIDEEFWRRLTDLGSVAWPGEDYVDAAVI